MTIDGSALAKLFNAIGYQAVWFALVVGAARGDTGWALLAAAVFVAIQVALGGRFVAELKVLGLALLCGLIVDGVPSLAGWWRYASPSPSLPPGGAPVWILALWLCFATTLSRSLSFLRRRRGVAAVLGAIGGPMAYLAAARGWNAVVLPEHPYPAVAWLAVGWAIALPVLSHVATATATTLPKARSDRT
ncbi:DUF2878 domain-containing protein [Luteibacter sp. 329MFSha]|uniref:DUF2878 domain-containing protein n=1 Tax=Luteibacter sp. 329MFSha TaxID=1798239 RepID=UPI0008CD205A|nr:DUF2878 domain-containing protein [Luteibacter sp. 329MFSha]SEV92735.1 Protein of unknown function [Luteibacter sp. 329MFSha]